MFVFYKKKIAQFINTVTEFVRNNVIQVIIVGGVFIFLEVIRSIPYINLIPSYQFFVIGITFLTAIIFIRVSIPIKNLVWLILILFAVAAIGTIFSITILDNLIGFFIYVLLIYVVIHEFLKRRKEFKDNKNIE